MSVLFVALAQIGGLVSELSGIPTSLRYSLPRRDRKTGKWRAPGVHCVSFVPPSSGIDVERTLRKYGVPVWGRGIAGIEAEPDGTRRWCFRMRVPRSQRRWAEYLMARYGAEVQNPLNAAAVKQAGEASGMPRPWRATEQPAQKPQPGRGRVGRFFEPEHRGQ